jgi:hypothetical protein
MLGFREGGVDSVGGIVGGMLGDVLDIGVGVFVGGSVGDTVGTVLGNGVGPHHLPAEEAQATSTANTNTCPLPAGVVFSARGVLAPLNPIRP